MPAERTVQPYTILVNLKDNFVS